VKEILVNSRGKELSSLPVEGKRAGDHINPEHSEQFTLLLHLPGGKEKRKKIFFGKGENRVKIFFAKKHTDY